MFDFSSPELIHNGWYMPIHYLTALTLQVHCTGHFHCVLPTPVGLTGSEDSDSAF